ncbi:MAG: hypothetical protein R2941_03840 [Desulfobacterales bacterium]
MMEGLEHFWQERLYDLDTVVILLKDWRRKGFCAGLDMKDAEIRAGNECAGVYRFQARLARLNLAMRRAPQPLSAWFCAAAGEFSLPCPRIFASSAGCVFLRLISISDSAKTDMSCSYFFPA